MKVLLLDFNGTLFFDSGFHQEAWVNVYKELNHEAKEDPKAEAFFGPRNDVIIQRMAPWLSKEERQRVSRHKESMYRTMCSLHPEEVHLVPGVEEFLEEAKRRNIPFILASASIKENIDFYFDTFDLGRWFCKEQCVYDDGSYENKGEMHMEAARRLGVSLSECLIVEDSLTSLKEAKETGAGCIVAIGNDNTKEKIMELGVDHFIYDFTEMNFSWFDD